MGTFNASSPIQSGTQFSLTGDTFSPGQTHTTVDCILYFGSQPTGTVVSTASLCDPMTPTFTYTASSGTYYIYESNGSDNWTSNDVSYSAPTPTITPTPQITPMYVDFASGSAFSQGLYHQFYGLQLSNLIIIFVLIGILFFYVIRRVL